MTEGPSAGAQQRSSRAFSARLAGETLLDLVSVEPVDLDDLAPRGPPPDDLAVPSHELAPARARRDGDRDSGQTVRSRASSSNTAT